jgi:hypothetical protein
MRQVLVEWEEADRQLRDHPGDADLSNWVVALIAEYSAALRAEHFDGHGSRLTRE